MRSRQLFLFIAFRTRVASRPGLHGVEVAGLHAALVYKRMRIEATSRDAHQQKVARSFPDNDSRRTVCRETTSMAILHLKISPGWRAVLHRVYFSIVIGFGPQPCESELHEQVFRSLRQRLSPLWQRGSSTTKYLWCHRT